MDIGRKRDVFLIILPALCAFFLALIPTFKYTVPLSWDIYYHIHNATLYMGKGIVFWDPLTSAPHGRPIYYPPLFHIMLVFLSKITGLGFFTVSRFMQPVFAFLILLSFSYVSGKLYGPLAGFLTGIFLFSSLFFMRMIFPIPESLAMISIPLFVYGYYRSMEGCSRLYPVLSGLLLGLMLMTHMLSASIILAVVTLSTMVLYIGKYDIRPWNLLIILGSGFLLASVWYAPLIVKYGFVFRSPPTSALPLKGYITHLGVLLTILSLAGIVHAAGRREKKDVIMAVWTVFVLALTAAYLLGLKVLSDRILYFALFPMATLSADLFNSIRINNGKWSFYAIILLISLYCIYDGYSLASSIKLEVSDSELDIAEWFRYNGDHATVVVSDYHIQPAIVAISGQPVSAGGYAPGTIRSINVEKYISSFNYTKHDIMRDRVGYIILDNEERTPPYSRLVYRNRDFSVYRVNV